MGIEVGPKPVTKERAEVGHTENDFVCVLSVGLTAKSTRSDYRFCHSCSLFCGAAR